MAASGKKNMFNEATRVQMPAMVHLTRLGYTYFGKITEDMAGTVYDPDTNILINIFKEQFARLNPTHAGEAEQTLKTIRQELDNDDIGRSFYERLSSVSPVRLVDFENPKNNTYHFTAEFTCKRDQDEFRPDITLFVNGLPLVFVEVKKPNNHGGMVAESKRMNQKRFPNKKFRRFLNITQLMIFSNNMEYDTMGGIVPVQGAFYCTTAKQSAPFNCFREENPTNLDIAPYNADFPYKVIDPIVEKKILTDFNCQVIHTSPEYQTNLDTYTPTNRVLTSMCSPERLLFILKYGIAYVRFHKEINGKIGVLYAVAYTLKMSYKTDYKIEGFFEYVVPPLEGFWWRDNVEGVDYTDKSAFNWISVIRLPDFIAKKDFDWAVETASKKKKMDCSGAEFLSIDEGLCVQIMHIGAFDDEPATVTMMDKYLEENGYVNDFIGERRHHEIYLSDPRKVAPEKCKTVIRHPIKKA